MTTIRTAALAGAACAALTLAACATSDTEDMADPPMTAPMTMGGFTVPEGATYDAEHDRYLVGNAAAFGEANDGYITALNPDGSVQALRWVAASEDQELRNPLGVATHAGALYVVDTPYVRRFDLETAAPLEPYLIGGAQILNDLDVDADGTVYVTEMGSQEPESWAVYRISPDSEVTEFARGEELDRPNGVEIGNDGRVILAPVGEANLVVLGMDGAVEETIPLPSAGNDGLIVLEDSLLVSAPGGGTIVRVYPDGTTETIAEGLAQPASIGFDPTRNVIIVPQLGQHAVTLVSLP